MTEKEILEFLNTNVVHIHCEKDASNRKWTNITVGYSCPSRGYVTKMFTGIPISHALVLCEDDMAEADRKLSAAVERKIERSLSALVKKDTFMLSKRLGDLEQEIRNGEHVGTEIWQRIRELTANEREVWCLRKSGNTYQVCGDAIGVSRERARQIFAKAERKIRIPPMATMGPEDNE